MPSVNQIKSDTTYNPQIVARKKQRRNMFFLLVTGVAGWLLYNTYANIYTISDEIFATRNEGKFKELFATPYKKIIWFGADCPVSAQRKHIIDTLLKSTGLDKYYVHHPYLQNSLSVQCPTKECMDLLIMNKCSSDACIIIPAKQKIIKIPYKNMIGKLEKYKYE